MLLQPHLSVSCAAVQFIHLLANTHICVCAFVLRSGPPLSQGPEEIGPTPPALQDYKARRVGELRMSTDSDLPPKLLWPSNSSAREFSSAQENVKTDR